MTNVYITVGVAGSGKSTYVKEQIKNDRRAIRLSSDYIREAIPEIEDDNAEVFRVMNEALRMHINDKYFDDIYYDATNLSRKRRRALYSNIKSWDENAEVSIIFFSVPYHIAVERNNKRDRNVPESVILRMYRQMQVPRMGVDCDTFKVVGIPMFSIWSRDIEEPNRVEDVFNYMNREWVPEISLTDTEHDTPWHLEDIFTHINMTIDNSDNERMKRIAFFHDLGKGICKVKKGDRSVYRGHADVSAHYFLNYLYFTKTPHLGFLRNSDFEDLEIIHQHMNMHNEMGEKNIRRNKLTENILDVGREFAEIDSKSKIMGDI